jgi:hypothetical protein
VLASFAMYVFVIFGLPLGFVLLYLRTYPREEALDVRRAFTRGMVAFVPTWIAARLLGSLVPAVYGSFLLSLHELADRTLPYACAPAAAYLAFYRFRDDRGHGFQQRRLTAFYAGALSPAGLGEMTRIWGAPDSYTLFAMPFILGAIVLAAPRVALALRLGYGAGLAGLVLASVAGLVALSLGPWLFLAQLWPLSLAIAAGSVAAAWFLASPELGRRPPQPAIG